MASRAVVRRGDDRTAVTLLDHAHDRSGVEGRPVGEHDERVRDLVVECGQPAAKRCAGAVLPVRRVHQPCLPAVAEVEGAKVERVRSGHDDHVVHGRERERVEHRRQQLALFRPPVPRRGAGGEHDGGDHRVLRARERRVLDHDRLDRLLVGVAQPPDAVDHRAALDDLPEQGVLRRQAGVRCGDDEELTARRPCRL